MTTLHPWLSNNCLRQAYLAFDMDTPGDLPQRPIVQILKIGTSTVTMGKQKTATLKLQCTDGGMGQNIGVVFTQPDMLLPSRIHEADFELKVGSALILLEYRVQQSPKTQLKYIRVSEMLVIDTMLHLRSEVPIQCRPPVARSQIINRENISGESLRETAYQQTTVATHNLVQGPSQASHIQPGSQYAIRPGSQVSSQSPHLNKTMSSPEIQGPSVVVNYPPCTTESYHTQTKLLSQYPDIAYVRKTSSFGYNPATTENLLTLSSLSSKNHGDPFDCVAIIQSVFSVRQINSIGKMKRDVHIIDQSQARRTILSGTKLRDQKLRPVWRDLEFFEPAVGDVILLKRGSVHRYDGRSLNAYDQAEIVLNPERDDCVAIREWWEIKELEKNGLLDDFADDLED